MIHFSAIEASLLAHPAVELVQIGEVYYVQDGHHRISVSRAFGQIAMDAEVTTWKAQPPFPWQSEVLRERPQPLASFDLSM